MTSSRHCSYKYGSRRGAMVVLIAFCLPMLLALLVLFLGVTQIQLARGEMRVVADAAARAATESILRTEDEEAAFQQALAVTHDHNVSQEFVTLERSHVIFGQGRSVPNGEWQFLPGQQPYNAAQVQVVKSRDSQSGSVQLLLSLFGSTDFETSVAATASQIDHDIMFVIEAGGSMHAPNRWRGVLEALNQLVEVVPALGNTIRVGIVICHDEPVLAQSLAPANHEFLSRMIELHNDVKDVKLVQGRNLAGGLEMASDVLEAEKRVDLTADQTIIFLGNGHNNRGMEPVVAGELAATRAQVIYCVTFGHNADKDGKMEAAAAVTGGKFFDVQDLSILQPLFKELLVNPSIVLIR